MRVVVHDYAGHPFQVQLSRVLAARGHDVLHLHCSSFQTGKGSLSRTPADPAGFEVEGIDIGEPFQKYVLRKRWRQERTYARLCADRIASYGPEVVLSGNTPLFAQQVLLPLVREKGFPYVFWQQDVYSVAMQDAARRKLPVVGGALGSVFVRMEQSLLRASDHIVVISADFLDILDRWGIPADAVTVIENWAPLDELTPEPQDNPWSRAHGLAGRRVLLYAGTLGLKHDPGILLALARDLDRHGDAVLVVVSEGLGADWLREQTAHEPCPSLVQLPYQDFEVLPQVFGTAEVLLAILEPEAGVFSVPSKILSYHCAARALLAAIPPENLGVEIIRREQSGLTTDPGAREAFVAAARALLDDPARTVEMGRRARAYAERAFDIERIADRFEQVLAAAVEKFPTERATE
jgi:glycosyltransferase involved in cell wall biosynthesis